MPDAINPSAIPGQELLPDVIDAHAAQITTIAASVRDSGSDVQLKWQGMSGVYSAPESDTLLTLMQPVSSQATVVGDNLQAVAAALTQFAAEARPIKAELDSLRAQAQAFVDGPVRNDVRVRELNPAWVSTQTTYGASYSATSAYSSPSTGGATTVDVPKYRTVTKEWHEDQASVDRNNELIAAVNAQQVQLWEAERVCANKIRALYGAQALRAATSENDPLGYMLDEIPEGTQMPWGAPVERTEGCGEATLNFVVKDFLWEGIAVGGVWGTIQGLGTLILGYNPATGGFFSGDAYGAAWGNLGMLGAGVAISATPPLSLLFAADDIAQQFGGGFLPEEISDFKDSTEEAWLNTGKALIAWDKWQDDPGTALGESVFNVGTLLIPVGGAAVAGVKTASTAASVLSKAARVVDFVDPAALLTNGALRVGGFGVGSLDNLIGKLELSKTFDAPNLEVYTAMDSASALRALNEWGVDLNDVTARVDSLGNDVLEFPGGRIEMAAGTFENAAGGVRVFDGGADAAIPITVREPELVAAGGVRGENGPGAVNSIVDEAPVRMESDGGGTVTAERDTGSGSHSGSSSAGAGGETGGGGGGGMGGSDSNPHWNFSDGDQAPTGPDQSAGGQADTPPASVTPVSDAIANGSDPVHSGASGVAGEWHRVPDDPITPKDVIYGKPVADHGTSTYPNDPGTGNVGFDLVDDPAAPYGRHPDNTPLTKPEYDARYVFKGTNWDNYPPNAGAVRGSRVLYTDPAAFLRDYGNQVDRIGPPSGDYLGLKPDGVPAVFEGRGLPVSALESKVHDYQLSGKMPAGWTIEISEIAPAFGRDGGGMQLLIRDETGLKMNVNDLLDRGVLE